MAATIAAATGSGAPDPRLATEDELRAFIDEMKPEDFDVTSPEFRALPTELQYEIVGDLRLRSRQTSHKRLQQMLRGAPTALDFSRAQIAALGQRNTLTQQLLDVSGMSADVNISIPVRVASARNREYMLVRNEGPNGGWVLGRISDVGTEAKPIDVDVKSDDERPLVAGRPMERPVLEDESDEDDDDMEQVEV
jgi:DNA excision repair protein ERCC-5